MRRHSPAEIGRFLEAAAALTFASAAIALLPFRTVVRLTGRNDRHGAGSKGEEGIAAEVRLAVKRASRRLPWRTVCFQEGLAAHWMLRRRGLGSRLHYGLKQTDGKLEAHVWVTLAGESVVGGAQAPEFAEVAAYP